MTDHLHDRVDQAIGKALDDDSMHNLTDLQQRLTATVMAAFLATGIDGEQRIRLDDLTSNDLDDLYDDLDRYAEVVGEMNERLVHLEQRAGRAEDALTRVREAAAWTRRNYPGLTSVNDRLATALNEPAPAATQAADGNPPLGGFLPPGIGATEEHP